MADFPARPWFEAVAVRFAACLSSTFSESSARGRPTWTRSRWGRPSAEREALHPALRGRHGRVPVVRQVNAKAILGAREVFGARNSNIEVLYAGAAQGAVGRAMAKTNDRTRLAGTWAVAWHISPLSTHRRRLQSGVCVVRIPMSAGPMRVGNKASCNAYSAWRC